MKRGAPLKRTPMRRTSKLRATSLRRVGARRERDTQALFAFRVAVLQRAGGACERCGRRTRLDAHHIVPRSRAHGWPLLHHVSNGAALCGGERGCHMRVHRHEVEDWREWLKSAPARERVA